MIEAVRDALSKLNDEERENVVVLSENKGDESPFTLSATAALYLFPFSINIVEIFCL